jgi:cell division protein FtsL
MEPHRQMRRWLNIAAALIIVALVVGLYKAKTDAAKAQAHVRQLEQRIEDAQADMRALRAEIASQESPAHVEALARDQFGARSRMEPLPERAIDERLPAPHREEAARP